MYIALEVAAGAVTKAEPWFGVIIKLFSKVSGTRGFGSK
jgi:hypothetical protein